jgi:hypothetical protein
VLLAKNASSQLVRLGALLSAVDKITGHTAGCGVGVRVGITVIGRLIDLLWGRVSGRTVKKTKWRVEMFSARIWP